VAPERSRSCAATTPPPDGGLAGRGSWSPTEAASGSELPGRPLHRAPVQQLAPAAVVLAPCFHPTREIHVDRHALIVETAGHWCVRGAPADVENLGARVGIGLTSGAVG